MKSIFLILVAVVVSSCTTLSKEDCQTMNWNERGTSDALQGKTSKVFADYTQTCSKHGIAVNQDEYAKGRTRGLRLFCTYENGQQFGREGESYNGVCPQKLETEFLKGYRMGKREYEIEQKEKEALRDMEASRVLVIQRVMEVPIITTGPVLIGLTMTRTSKN